MSKSVLDDKLTFVHKVLLSKKAAMKYMEERGINRRSNSYTYMKKHENLLDEIITELKERIDKENNHV